MRNTELLEHLPQEPPGKYIHCIVPRDGGEIVQYTLQFFALLLDEVSHLWFK